MHQLRIGIRRLCSALRSFDGWVPTPPDKLVAALRPLFALLGQSRDSNVLESGVGAHLAGLGGALSLPTPADREHPDPGVTVCADETQAMFLEWLAWRTEFAAQTVAVDVSELPKHEGEKTFHRKFDRTMKTIFGAVICG